MSFTSGVPWTAIVLIVTVISLVGLVAVWVFFKIPFTPGDPFSSNIIFVDLVNKPFLVASSFGNARFIDRPFFEHTLQAAVVGGLENSNSQAVQVLMQDYLEFYDLDYYNVELTKNKEKIFEITNLPQTCGIDALCVPKYLTSDAGVCNVGRVKTEAECESSGFFEFVCCQENVDIYKTLPPEDRFEVIPCGRNEIGVCSAQTKITSIWGSDEGKCGLGRIEIDDTTNNCEAVNDGKTQHCCAPLDVLITTANSYTVEIPMVYKNEQSILEVTVK